MNRVINLVLLLGGIGLIIFLFLGGILPTMDDNIMYLDMIVTIFIYALFMFNLGALIWTPDDIEGLWGGMGIFWLFISIYSVLALGTMIGSAAVGLVFVHQMFIHVALLLFLLFGLYFTAVSGTKVVEVAAKQQAERSGIKQIESLVVSVDINMSSCEFYQNLKPQIETIKDQVHYLTASKDAVALELEGQCAQKLSSLKHSLQTSKSSLTQARVADVLNECIQILEHRTRFRYN